MISTPFPWSPSEWRNLSERVEGLFTQHLIDRLNTLLTEYLEVAAETETDDAGHDDGAQRFVSTLVLRYVDAERPLSGYFLVCSLTEIQWVLLGQVLASNAATAAPKQEDDDEEEAAAANNAWSSLVSEAAVHVDLDEPGVKAALEMTRDSALKCFEDLLVQIEEMDVEPSMETYAYETMAESLVRRVSSLKMLHKGMLTAHGAETGVALLGRPERPRSGPVRPTEAPPQRIVAAV